jgi:hypothetical protein
MASLKTLPVELLYQICGHIRFDRTVLCSLSLVNTTLHAVSVSFLFHTVTVLDRRIDDLLKVETMPSTVALNIRHLIIENKLSREPQKFIARVTDQWPTEETDSLQYNFYNNTYTRWTSMFDPPFLETATGYAEDVDYVEKRNRRYRPVAALIMKIPALQDLTYNSSLLLPLCILNSLHTAHPSSRLHISHFPLWNLEDPNPKLTEHEIAIMKSPCLHSITCGGEFKFSFTEALVDLVTSLSPNLRSVEMHSQFAPNASRPRASTPSWRSLEVKENPKERNKASLNRLVMPGWDIVLWLQVTDSSKLRTLDLYQKFDLDMLKYIVACDFPSLENLGMDLETHGAPWNSHFQFDKLVCQFVCGLPSLIRLELGGDVISDVFDKILDGQGSKLRVLRVCKTGNKLHGFTHPREVIFTEKEVQRVRELCPNLVDFFYE